MSSEEFDDAYDLDRTMRLKAAIQQVFEENAELFERLSDNVQ